MRTHMTKTYFHRLQLITIWISNVTILMMLFGKETKFNTENCSIQIMSRHVFYSKSTFNPSPPPTPPKLIPRTLLFEIIGGVVWGVDFEQNKCPEVCMMPAINVQQTSHFRVILFHWRVFQNLSMITVMITAFCSFVTG